MLTLVHIDFDKTPLPGNDKVQVGARGLPTKITTFEWNMLLVIEREFGGAQSFSNGQFFHFGQRFGLTRIDRPHVPQQTSSRAEAIHVAQAALDGADEVVAVFTLALLSHVRADGAAAMCFASVLPYPARA